VRPTSSSARRGLRGAAITAALGLCTTFGVAACNFIVGAGSYSVGDTGDGGGDSGGLDQFVADTNMGDTGSVSDGPGFIDACVASNVDPVKLERITKACVLYLSCDPYCPNSTLSQCISNDYPEAYQFYSCSLTATSCAQLDTCTGYDYATAADCPAAGASCNGSRAANCFGAGANQGAVDDCSVNGGTCTTYTTDAGTFAGCNVMPTCTETDGLQHCIGNTLYTCVSGVGIGDNCSTGTTCKTGGSGTSCYQNLPSCQTTGTTCAGSDLQDCFTDGTQATFHCGNVGLACDGTNGQCLAPGCSATDTAGCTESCNGSTMGLCVGGAKVMVDCTKYGFSTCQMVATTTCTSFTTPFAQCFP